MVQKGLHQSNRKSARPVPAAMLLMVVVGVVVSTMNARIQLSSYITANIAISKSTPTHNTTNNQSLPNVTLEEPVLNDDCFRARNDTVDPSMYHKLEKPFINLGFPKMGTSSLQKFFECGGVKSDHYNCNQKEKNQLCVSCMRQSVNAGLPPFSMCGNAEAFTQLDNGYYFPQIELLEEILEGYPNGTFLLTFRSIEKWYQSLAHWPKVDLGGPKMDMRLKRAKITGSPTTEKESHPEEFGIWFCNHVNKVRHLISQNPLQTLIEIDIEDSTSGERMEDIFGIDKNCWGHVNMNAAIHPEVNTTQQ